MATSDYEIGRVVAVDTAQITIELSRDLKALTRVTYEGSVEVGRINSYVIIPVGNRRIVAMVTKVVLTEESELRADTTMVTLPSSRRLMKATMIGTIEDKKFRQGISLFPILDSSVYITSKDDLDIIFGSNQTSYESEDKPGYCIPIGKSAIFQDYQIKIDPDAFFGKHAAVIGSTGSGKSCSIATILQSILEQDNVQQTRFIILDTNGEYRSAFQKKIEEKDCWIDAIDNCKCLYIPTDPSDKDRLTIPYWFMNSEDFIRLFRAAPGVQRPVLINALSCARDEVTELEQWKIVRDKLINEINNILSLSTRHDGGSAGNIVSYCEGIKNYLQREENHKAIKQLSSLYDEFDADNLIESAAEIIKIIGSANKNGYYNALNIDKEQRIEKELQLFLEILTKPVDGDMGMTSATADNPRYFNKSAFRYRYLENALTRDELNLARARENSSTMLMRIYRLLEDSRFEFLFGPTSSEWPYVEHSLASFLRDILGMKSNPDITLSGEDNLPPGELPFYDRQRKGAGASNVVIIDLSLLASEVLENVTALIGRLILEFLQRLSDQEVSKVQRGYFPVVLILEEAQNYIKEHTGKSVEESISKQVFERVAREGRKFGLGLVVASQRPSELSKTVLSQCNSFIVHRLQNPEDLRYFKEIVPSIYGQLLDQLPALVPRMALVLGECVQAPALVEMREVNPAPSSKNPKFYKSWVNPEQDPDVEAVCAKWEGI
jgi:DNA helicase HerA-like ATPase